MPLSIADRKHQMPHGAQRAIAKEIGVAESYVSAVMNDDARPKTARARKTVRRVQVAIARKLGRRVDDVFGDVDATIGATDDRVAIPA